MSQWGRIFLTHFQVGQRTVPCLSGREVTNEYSDFWNKEKCRSTGNCRVCAGCVENVEIMWKDKYAPLKLWKSNKWPLKQPIFRKT